MQELLKDYYLIIIVCLSVLTLILLIIVLVDQFYIKKQLREKIKEQEDALIKWRAWYNQNPKPKSSATGITIQQQKGFQHPNNHTSTQNVLTNGNKTKEASNLLIGGNCIGSSNSTVATEKQQRVHTSHYLQEANSGKFMRLLQSSEKCFFRTWEEDGVRRFEFCGNVDKALANINAIFDDVCEIEGKRSGATYIENVSAGTLDSELRIITKAKIRLK